MRVFLDHGEGKQLIGTADIPPDHGPVYVARLFGPGSVMVESFTIGTITHLPSDGSVVAERVVIVTPQQTPSILPRWQSLSS